MIPARIRILYLILSVLIFVSVVPLLFYSNFSLNKSREALETNEKELQNTITRSVRDEIEQRQSSQRVMLNNLASAVLVSTGGDFGGKKIETPELRALLERFVSSSEDIAYATLINAELKGVRAGRIDPDPFLQRQLEHAFMAARDGREYSDEPLSVDVGKEQHTVLLVSTPVMAGDRFVGVIASVIDLSPLVGRLKDASQGALEIYVVDGQGRMVASPDPKYATGQDMTKLKIVHDFVEAGKMLVAPTEEFEATDKNGEKTTMVGTYSRVPSLGWAVVAQKDTRQAYASYFEMQQKMRLVALIVVLGSIVLGVFAASKITTPLGILTETSRAIAKGDFSQRVKLRSRTEIGELADTFNHMSADLERFVEDLKRAAEENRTLFLNSIQMIAGAVDEKDPYTKGHSDRVTRYSMVIAAEMGLAQDEIEKIRIAAQLHDVGKIGIEDRILKKPGALTPEEFEIMKTHTTKGAAILRPVAQLKDMIPGIELHHESLDGRGYPYGHKGDQVPLMPRIIMVADTFDAMTTNRPYQAAMDPEYVIRIINSLTATKFDSKVVAALTAVFERGQLKVQRVAANQQAAAAAAPATPADAPGKPASLSDTGVIRVVESNRM